jgi:integrase
VRAALTQGTTALLPIEAGKNGGGSELDRDRLQARRPGRLVEEVKAVREGGRVPNRIARSGRYRGPLSFTVPVAQVTREHNPSNFRRDVLRPAVEAANAKLDEDGIATIGPITFHSLRRTYASLRCAVGDDVAYTASQLGHEDPRFSLKVYAQATKRRERIRAPTVAPMTRRSNGREWALARPNSRSRFPPRQHKAPPERGFVWSG